MTLGDLIVALKREPKGKHIALGFGNPHSYRGYYEQVAFEPVENTTVGAMLAAARSAVGATYEGYKGGEYTMATHTRAWLAFDGCCGEEIGTVLLNCLLGHPPLRGLYNPWTDEKRQEGT